MQFGKQLKEGLLTQNPVLVQLLGMCSTLAITTTFSSGIGMGISVTIILTLSNIIISLLRKFIPDKIRIAAYIVVIATFVSMVDLLLQAYLSDIAESLGVFLPLIVVNCIILARAESFASKHGVIASAWDGICQGLGYTLVLLVMSIIREFLGSGTFGAGVLNGGAGYRIFAESYGAQMMVQPVGGFLTLGVLIALMQWARSKAGKGGK